MVSREAGLEGILRAANCSHEHVYAVQGERMTGMTSGFCRFLDAPQQSAPIEARRF